MIRDGKKKQTREKTTLRRQKVRRERRSGFLWPWCFQQRELSAILGKETCKCVSVRLLQRFCAFKCVREFTRPPHWCVSSVSMFVFVSYGSTLSLLLPGSRNYSDNDSWKLPGKHRLCVSETQRVILVFLLMQLVLIRSGWTHWNVFYWIVLLL